MPDFPFEHRKFSVESLKEAELMGPSKQVSVKQYDSRNQSEEGGSIESVGNNNQPNETNKYTSQILIVSDKRDRSGSCDAACETPSHKEAGNLDPSPEHLNSDPRLDA